MRTFSRRSPNGETIAAQRRPRRTAAQHPPQGRVTGAASSAGRAGGSPLAAFVAGCIAALPELPADSGSRLCLQLYLIGAANAFWHLNDLPATGAIRVLSRLMERHGLPGNETAGLIEALPQLRRDPDARRVLREGEQAMATFLADDDPSLVLRLLEASTVWHRGPVYSDAEGSSAHPAEQSPPPDS